MIQDIINERRISMVFQCIYDLDAEAPFGYEALSRGPSDSPLHAPDLLFKAASEEGLLPELELLCVTSSVEKFIEQALSDCLFVSLSHETLITGSQNQSLLKPILSALVRGDLRIVIALNEKSVANNIDDLKHAISLFKEKGFEIAIDDLGVGHSTLRLWSEIKPDYVKIDRHFINHIDTDLTKQEFVRSIIQVAHLEGAKIITTGVETRPELELLTRLDVSLVQGFFIHRPERLPRPIDDLGLHKPHKDREKVHYAESLISSTESVDRDARVMEVVERFQCNVSLNSIAVVKAEEPIGMVHRKRFLTEISRPFAIDLHGRKPIFEVMDQEFLKIDAKFRIEQASRLVTDRARLHAEEDFVVVRKGKYLGMGQVIDLLRQITEIQVSTARHANPLTMLPGNVPIGDCVDRLIERDTHFIVSYFDLDYFKPFNDRYGYAIGDQVLLLLAELLKKYVHMDEDFVGHIGGDDFIAVTSGVQKIDSICRVVREFKDKVSQFYNETDRANGGIQTVDRHGEYRFFSLMRVSVGCIEVYPGEYASYRDISKKLVTVKGFSKEPHEYDIVLEKADGRYVFMSAENPDKRIIRAGDNRSVLLSV